MFTQIRSFAFEAVSVVLGVAFIVAITPDVTAIAIENERDEDVNDGEMPQSPPGFLTIVDLVGAPTAWPTRDVALTGEEIELPDSVNQQQKPNGFEGVATNADGSQVYVAFQREWADDPAGFVKIGRYTPATHEWAFYRYPLDAPPGGGWVGLSEITWIGDDILLVVERDNQQRDNAQVKRLYSFSVAGITPASAGGTPPVLTKTLVRDLLVEDDYRLEKIEGAALTKSGVLLVVNDNDGAGETRLLRLHGVVTGHPPR